MTGGRRRRLGAVWRARLAPDQDPVQAVIVLVIAAMTLLTAVLAGLQVDAGARSAVAGRTADAIDADGTARGTGALVQTAVDLGVYRRWVELFFDQSWARRVGSQVPGDDVLPGDVQDPDLAAELVRIDGEVAEWARRQTPLLLEPYWDPSTSRTDIGALDAERNIGPATRASHERRLAQREAGDWGRRAADYVTTITLVAVGLFFLGLAAAMAGTARRILAVAGVAFGIVALVAGTAISLRPVERVPGEAIDALVAAEMALGKVAWSATQQTVDAADRENYGAAIAAADRAVNAAPAYTPARLTRAETRLRFAQDLVLAREPDPAAAQPLLDQALADYRVATASADAPYAAWWNYGWAAYLAGDEPTAIAATSHALGLAPDQFTLYLNRALARLAGGDLAGSRADVATALEVASRARLDSNGWFFAATDYNIGRLAATRPDEADELRAIQRQIRETAIALRIGRTRAPAGSVGGVDVTTLSLDDRARFVEGGPVADGAVVGRADVVGFRVRLRASDLPAGAVLSIRVHGDEVEQPEFRVDRAWPAGATETAVDLVTPYGRMGSIVDPGDYEVEAYLDGVTVATIAFRVEQAASVQIAASDLVAIVAGGGMTCAEPEPSATGPTTVCLTTGADRETGIEVVVSADADDHIEQVQIGSAAGNPLMAGFTREMAGLIYGVMFETTVASLAADWAKEAEPGTSREIGGATFEASETDDRFTLTVELP